MSEVRHGVVRILSRRGTRAPWRLVVSGLKPEEKNLRWEQFVRGGFTVYDDSGGSEFESAKEWIRKLYPNARTFGEWIEDYPIAAVITIDQALPSGKRELTGWAKCIPPGVKRKTPGIACGRYVFDDTPGEDLQLGPLVTFKGLRRRLIGVEWDAGFHHKIWILGQDSLPYYEIQFFIIGGKGYKLTKVGAQQVRKSIPKLDIKVRFQR